MTSNIMSLFWNKVGSWRAKPGKKTYTGGPRDRRTQKDWYNFTVHKSWNTKFYLRLFWVRIDELWNWNLKRLISTTESLKECAQKKLKRIEYILKNCSLLKIENNSSWVDFNHSREKTHLLALELLFVISSWRVYLYIKFDI